MRISVNQYAKSLYEATKGRSQAEADLLVENFLKLLQKNNQLKLYKNIIEKFSELSDQAEGVVRAEVVSVSKLGDENLRSIEMFVAKKYAAKKVIIINRTDEKIKGGLIIRIGDEMMDASVARKISNMKLALMR